MEQEYERAQAIADELEVEHNAYTRAIYALVQQNQRFSAETADLVRKRSEIKLAWDRVLGRIRSMEAERNGWSGSNQGQYQRTAC